MSAVPPSIVTREEYLRQERLAPSKSEYHQGKVVAMAGATRIHNQIAGNIYASLRTQLKGRRCRNYISDMRVSVRGGERYLYPDGVVTCGPEHYEESKQDSLMNPLVIIEVLSPSTEAYDRGDKFLYYQSIPSFREYVLVSQAPRRIEVFRKQPDGSWLYQSYPFTPPPVILESIDCTLTPDDVHAMVEEETVGEGGPAETQGY
jgi:Uma2 family endonuclease